MRSFAAALQTLPGSGIEAQWDGFDTRRLHQVRRARSVSFEGSFLPEIELSTEGHVEHHHRDEADHQGYGREVHVAGALHLIATHVDYLNRQ
jgi:hypothetical protein